MTSKGPGRPPKPGGRNKNVTFRIEPSLLRAVDAEAKRARVSRTAVIIASIRRFLRF